MAKLELRHVIYIAARPLRMFNVSEQLAHAGRGHPCRPCLRSSWRKPSHCRMTGKGLHSATHRQFQPGNCSCGSQDKSSSTVCDGRGIAGSHGSTLGHKYCAQRREALRFGPGEGLILRHVRCRLAARGWNIHCHDFLYSKACLELSSSH